MLNQDVSVMKYLELNDVRNFETCSGPKRTSGVLPNFVTKWGSDVVGIGCMHIHYIGSNMYVILKLQSGDHTAI